MVNCFDDINDESYDKWLEKIMKNIPSTNNNNITKEDNDNIVKKETRTGITITLDVRQVWAELFKYYIDKPDIIALLSEALKEADNLKNKKVKKK